MSSFKKRGKEQRLSCKTRTKKVVNEVPTCAGGCGYEFKLLTAMGLKKVVGMYCKTCLETRITLNKKLKEWNELSQDLRIKARVIESMQKVTKHGTDKYQTLDLCNTKISNFNLPTGVKA